MFEHLEKLPYSFYDNNETGKIMSRMTTDLWEISELAHHGPENLLISSISIVVSFIYLSSINLPLTLIIFACVPFLMIMSYMAIPSGMFFHGQYIILAVAMQDRMHIILGILF
jgi:ATP-binding cassette subfamily B protein